MSGASLYRAVAGGPPGDHRVYPGRGREAEVQDHQVLLHGEQGRSVVSAHIHKAGQLAVHTFTRPVSWQCTHSQGRSVGSAHIHKAGQLAVHTFTRSVGSAHIHKAGQLAVHTFTRPVSWQCTHSYMLER